MNTSSALRFLSALPLVGGLLAAVPDSRRPFEARPLNSFSVSPEFTLTMRMPLPDAATMSGPVIFRSADDQPRASIRGFVKYRSATLKSGDEIVSINGRPFVMMSPAEFFRAFPTGKKIQMEVRQPNSKEIRHVTVVPVWHPEDKFSDDATLKQFAEFARPACIFNERGKVLFDAGAERSIKSIVVDDRSPDQDDSFERLPQTIVVRLKQPAAKAPLLMLADSYQARVSTEKKSDREWVYTLDFSGEVGSARMKMCRFRLSI